MAMDFVMGEQVPKKSLTCPVSFCMSGGRTRNKNQSIYLISDSSLGNFLQQLYWKIILIHSFVCCRIWISQGWNMMTEQHLFFYFLYLEGAEIILRPDYGVILVKFVIRSSFVFCKELRGKTKEMFILLTLWYRGLSLKKTVGVCLCFPRQSQLKIYQVLC